MFHLAQMPHIISRQQINTCCMLILHNVSKKMFYSINLLTRFVNLEKPPMTWFLNVFGMLSVRKDALKYIDSAVKWIYINIFKGNEKSVLKSTEVMPINPLLSDSSVGKGRIVKWQAPKKSERAHLNDFDYSSPQPCLWFWKGGENSEFCL